MLIISILLSMNPAKAAFISLALPGSGDILLGEKKRGAYFLAAEATIWASYFGFRWYEDKMHNSSLNYAKLYASANIEGKDDSYFDAMENFYSSNSYNEWVKEQARIYYPDTTDPEILEQRREYIEENSYSGDDAWAWESIDALKKYDDLRDSKRGFANKATNMIGIAVANRLISFFVTYLTGDKVSVQVKENGVQLGIRF